MRLHSSSIMRFLAAAAALSLGGCATGTKGPEARDQVPVPANWQQAPVRGETATLDTAALAAWWTRFNDPVLEQLVTGALETSPDIRAALSKIVQARAQRGVTRAGLLPTLSGSFSAAESYRRDHNTHATSENDSYAAGLDAGWEIDLFGKNRASLDAATADLAQTEENYHAAQVSLAAEVAAAYVTLRSAEAQLAVVERNLVTRTETTDLTQWREQAGMGNALDTQQAISTLEQSRASLPSLRGNIIQARNQLTLLSGKTPGALDALLGETGRVPSATAEIAVGIPAETLRQRPDIRAAEQAVAATVFRVKAAELEQLPSLRLSGSIGIEALRAGDLFSPDATVGSLLAGLTAPLFEGGRIRQNIAVQNELQRQALLGYESAVLTALAEVEDALVASRHTAERLEILEKAVSSATVATALAELKYAAGEVDYLTLLEAQRTQLSLQEQQVSTTADYATAHIRLYKSLGGGWSRDAEPVPEGAAR